MGSHIFIGKGLWHHSKTISLLWLRPGPHHKPRLSSWHWGVPEAKNYLQKTLTLIMTRKSSLCFPRTIIYCKKVKTQVRCKPTKLRNTQVLIVNWILSACSSSFNGALSLTRQLLTSYLAPFT